mgnify:CR=1 FL=1
MQKNAIVPYILIMAFGIGLIFFLSLEGAGNQEEIAEEHAAGEEGEGLAGQHLLVGPRPGRGRLLDGLHAHSRAEHDGDVVALPTRLLTQGVRIGRRSRREAGRRPRRG